MLLDLKSWTNEDLCSWLMERKCVTGEAMKKLQAIQMNGYLLDQSLDEIKQVLKENLSATDTYRLMNESGIDFQCFCKMNDSFNSNLIG